MTPKIKNPGQLELPEGTEAILKELFAGYSQVVIKAKFGGGLSGSQVYLVRPIGPNGRPERPKVVKIAAISLIKKEVEAYNNHVHDKWPRTASLWGQPVLLPDGQRGGLCYTLIGEGLDDHDPLTFHDFCQQAELEDIRFVLAEQLLPIIEELARQSPPEYEFSLRHGYDALLPVNLWLEPGLVPAGRKLTEITPAALPDDLSVGDYVRLAGFAVSEVEPDNDSATLNIPLTDNQQRPGSYRIRLKPRAEIEADQLEQVIGPIEGRVTKTRRSLFEQELAVALGQTVDLQAARLPLSAQSSLPNPLLALEKLLKVSRDVRLGPVHGDMNFLNVLLDPKTHYVNLIDFSEARDDHILLDFLRLETSVMTRLVPALLFPYDALDIPRLVSQFCQQLHWAARYPGHFAPYLPHPALEKPLEMLRLIRRSAYQFLYKSGDDGEYYQALTLFLLGALKYRNLSEANEAPLPKTIAFWAAATAVGFYSGELEQAIPPCPYRGLEFFDVEHAANFFGREDLTTLLLNKLSTFLKSSPGEPVRFLAIVGPSGSGKSSLARAGLVAALKRGMLDGSAGWPIVICRPGSDPLQNLATAFATAIGLGETDNPPNPPQGGILASAPPFGGPGGAN